MASRLNEELMNTPLDMGDGEIKIEGKANPVYANAINVHNKKKKEIDKVLKDKKPELKKPFLGTKGNTTIMPKTPEMKKLKLSEDMFKSVREHMNDAPEAYEGIFRVVDNMEHIINYISELTDEELTYEDMKQSYDVLEEAMEEFKDYLEELKKPAKNEAVAVDVPTEKQKRWELQDKRNNKDVWSDIYNELVDMKSLETPHRRMGKQNRYKGSWDDANEIRVGASRDGEGIVVKAEEASDLDFAKEVAETYGVEWRIKEHTSRYADAKYELFIYPFRPVDVVVDESLNEAQCNYVDTYNGATIYECEGKYSADVPDYNGKYSHSKRVVAGSVEELKKKIDDADRQYRKDLEYTNESVKKRSRRGRK